MSKIKKYISVILCLCFLVITLTGCSKDQIKMRGDWVATIDLSSKFNSTINEYMKDEYNIDSDFTGVFTINTTYTFNLNGKCNIKTSKSQYKIEVADYTKKCSEYMSKKIYAYYKNHGNKSKSQVDKKFKDKYGQDVAGCCQSKLSDVLNNQGIIESFNTSISYKIKDSKMYKLNVSGEIKGYQTYTLDGDTLTLTGEYDNNDNPINNSNAEFAYPIVFSRIVEK